MIKLIEAIIVLALLLFSFFIGVKYSDQVKERASWLFETKEEEIELPNINGEGSSDMENPAINNTNQDINPQNMNQGVIIDQANPNSPPVPASAPAIPEQIKTN